MQRASSRVPAAVHRVSAIAGGLRKLPNAVAWDADHTLVRYRLDKLLPSIYNGLAKALVSGGLDWAEPWLSKPYDGDWVQRGLVFEISSGHLLKLDEFGNVARASHGTRMLSDDERAEAFPGRWARFDDLHARRRHPDFAVFITWFDVPAVLVLARLVDAVAEGACPTHPKDAADAGGYAWLWPNMVSAFDHIFDNIDGFRSSRGSFFEGLAAAPQEVVVPRPRLRRALERLRERGVLQVLATNSHFRFADFCLRASLGDDYASLFHLVVVNCGKGRWFAGRGASEGGTPFQTMCPAGWETGPVATQLRLAQEGVGGAAGGAAGATGAAGAPAARLEGRRGSGAGAGAEATEADADCDGGAWPAPEGPGGRIASLAGRIDDASRQAAAAGVVVMGNAADVARLVAAAPPRPARGGKWEVTADVTPPAVTGAAAEAAPPAKAPSAIEAIPAAGHFRAEALIDAVDSPQPPRRSSGPGDEAAEPFMVYVGDHPHGDVAAAVQDAGWPSVAVVEELQDPAPEGAPEGLAELYGPARGDVHGKMTAPGAGSAGRWGHAMTAGGARSWMAALLATAPAACVTDATLAAEWMAEMECEGE
ncbi:hypothetical protein FNF31_06944 [Cafeteria roenbergensis]|uniref:Uncharacterized protein n=1 Tax=Cafeteria roenbergensis TaxID=33653 RepID=A0A5A8CCN5_CAFRO|nr:hypothetical protein FNF31_06944 [Cafeteria roenbergensis]KAA0171550.1 hypothetical protein FNF28_00760 [Cafeteria roenbergensis]